VPVIGASYLPFFVYFIDLFLGDLGFFLFSNYFFNYLSQKSFIIDADPAMSSEVQGGLPQARGTRQGSRACGRPGQQEEARSNGKSNS
jgi:hypothetical protein